MKKKYKIAVIGMGYVGLPLAVEFAKKYFTIGFDINSDRILQIRNCMDKTLEIESEYLKSVLTHDYIELDDSKLGLFPTDNIHHIKKANTYIVTIPTPIDKYNLPILKNLLKVSETVGKVLKKDDIVIYESTVYPGVTEDECVPILEKYSNLKFNADFFVGYSPERINPGDKKRTITKILKVTSGSTPNSAKEIDNLYKSIIDAGTYLASSIKIAEAAKVIENSQRDINIAFVNELAKIFNLLDIDTQSVLDAARTKWNFLPFQPGLVGGHCIGVDPYYLVKKAQEVGYHPEVILAGRTLNESMGEYIATEVIKLMTKKDIKIKKANILVLGITFKENCPDVRNTKVIDVISKIREFGINVTIFDPWANPDVVKTEYGLESLNELPKDKFDAIILAVAHREFLDLNFSKFKKENSVIYDVKGILGNNADGKL